MEKYSVSQEKLMDSTYSKRRGIVIATNNSLLEWEQIKLTMNDSQTHN